MNKTSLKSIIVLATFALYLLPAFGQSPEKMSYQAVIRNSSDVLVTDTQVGMQISIVKGTVDGSPVYVETQTPTTNSNGLVSIEIGTGTTSDDFTTIDWANGPYFIKAETDPAGGTSYTITGTSQLLSVPYALHAKTAETFAESDPLFTSWDKTTGISITESQISDLGTYIETEIDPTVTKYSVGDFAQGGIVFWVDETGQHGLVAAKEDQSTGVRWYAGSYGVTRATGDGLFSGELNTSIIISSQVAIGDDGADYAAQICNDLQVAEGGKTYGDWYLPSKEELNLMYQNKATIDATAGANGGSGFASALYWSSTENGSSGAWGQRFNGGVQIGSIKNITDRVRAVRAF